jgi:hypothetical protein
MKAALRLSAMFLLQLSILVLGGHVVGNSLRLAPMWLTSPAACLGYAVSFNNIIGVSITIAALGAFLYWKAARRGTIWIFLAAVILADALFASHMKIATCS